MSHPSTDQLRTLDLFEECSDEQLARWAQAAELVEVEAGTVIEEQGQPTQAVHLVFAGTLLAVTVDVAGREDPVSEHHPPTWIGASAAVTEGVNAVSMRALTPATLASLEQLARCPEVVAVGECGLDYFRNLSPPETQREAFHRQLELAARVGKPVFLHQREAHTDFVAILSAHASQWRGVAHCFTGTAMQLEPYLGLGLAIGITGWICDERRGTHLAELMPRIPAARLLLETDGPYLLPRNLTPKPASRRNEPAYLPQIAAVVARSRGETVEALAHSSTQAARELFGLPRLT